MAALYPAAIHYRTDPDSRLKIILKIGWNFLACCAEVVIVRLNMMTTTNKTRAIETPGKDRVVVVSPAFSFEAGAVATQPQPFSFGTSASRRYQAPFYKVR